MATKSLSTSRNWVENGTILSDRMVQDSKYEFILHKCQKEALKSLVKWFSTKEKEDLTAVVVMPTGTGKTGVICCLPYVIGGAIKEGQISSIGTKDPILVIAPGIDILKQLEENLLYKPFLEKIGLLKPKEMGSYYSVHTVSKTREVKDLERLKNFDIILSNSQKWRKDKEEDIANYEDLPPDLFSMVIVDEAHHLPADQWQDIVHKFNSHAKLIFFTATPYRTDRREITTDLAISHKGFAYKLTREQAIKDKLIRRVQLTVLPEESEEEDMEGEEVNEAECTLKDTPPSPPPKKVKVEKQAAKRMKCATKVLIKVKECMERKNRDSRLPGNAQHASIIIIKKIDDANKVKKILTTELGFEDKKVKVVHNESIKNETKREKVLTKIQMGEYEIVIIVKMLLEGFDYPPFSIAGIVTEIKSPVKFAQFIGRVQRLVRHKNEDGAAFEIEEGVVADIITHEYFKQQRLYDKYINPKIPKTGENLNIDED